MSVSAEELRDVLLVRVGNVGIADPLDLAALRDGIEKLAALAGVHRVRQGVRIANGEATMSITAIVRLASALRHADEYMETGNPVDEGTARSLMSDPEVLSVMAKLDDLAMLPVKR